MTPWLDDGDVRLCPCGCGESFSPVGSRGRARAYFSHQRHVIGIDLSREYLELAARRLQQLSLLT